VPDLPSLAQNFAALLSELDETCPINRPVVINRDLVPLFKKHGGITDLVLMPYSRRMRVRGIHAGSKKNGRAVVLYERCDKHDEGELNPGCPACQASRYNQAKELLHCLDGDEERTPPGSAAEALVHQLVTSAWEAQDANADILAEVLAFELLVRFRLRAFMLRKPQSFELVTAQQTGDYSQLARQFGVPLEVLRHAFSPNYMTAMANFRQSLGLPTTPCDWPGA
jgi:hypothetical protein